MQYYLPAPVLHTLTALAERSDVLLLGEMHGTREVPQVAERLLDILAPLGYAGLAIEIPANFRDATEAWARQTDAAPPRFFARPPDDGRGNEQVLALIADAVRRDWQLLLFDLDPETQPYEGWHQRDADMARNFTAQRARLCPGRKILGICGNVHSRLTRAPEGGPIHRLWPSFAARVQGLDPRAVVSAVDVVCHQGGYFNCGQVHVLNIEPIDAPYTREEVAGGHSLTLHLPRATPATFFIPPPA